MQKKEKKVMENHNVLKVTKSGVDVCILSNCKLL